MSKHTPEPWSVAGIADEIIVAKVSELSHAHIATIHHNENDSRRIVACVNALEGVETSALENIDSAARHAVSELGGFVSVVHESKVRIDELLEALELSVQLMDHFGEAYGCVPSNYIEYKKAIAAIAKSKGGAA